jgi:glycosyltransferase involved in cell wall biosynthesis
MGIDREVVSFDAPGASYLGKDIFPVYGLGPGKSRWCYNPSLFPWLVHNIPRFDVIIINGLWLYHGFAVRRAIAYLTKLKKAGKLEGKEIPRVFIMTHGMLDPYFQRASNRKLKAIRNWIYWKLIEHKVVNHADGLLFTCETELLLARESFRPYHPKKEINISYGVDPPPPYSAAMREEFLKKCPEAADGPYLLYLSRIHEKKGIDLLINAFAEQIKKKEDPEKVLPKLVIAGPGLESRYGRKIEQLASAMPPGTILFPGMLTGDAKWGAFYGCSAFILPSHQENFGIAVVEALACSKPVLISDQVNIWPEVKEGKGGIIAPDTLEGTRELLESWLNMEEKQTMNHNARLCYEKNFNIQLVSLRFFEAVRSDKTEVTACYNPSNKPTAQLTE